MAITVRFFANLREQLGVDAVAVTPRDGLTAADAWHEATEGRALPTNALVAINMEYAVPQQPVMDGDEVAFFPPVTGG